MPQDDRSTTATTPLAALAARWWLAVGLVVLLAGVGVVVATLQAATYTGEARVTVGSESLDARIVAGYSNASTQLASDISRYVNDQEAQGALDTLLGDTAGVESVSASPIPGSSVIRVEVLADSASAAAAGAQAIAQQLVDQVNAVSGESADSLLQQYTDLTNQVSAAQVALDDARANLASLTGAEAAQPALDAAKGLVAQTSSALSVLEVQQTALSQRYRSAVTSTPAAAGLRIVQEGRVADDDTSSRLQQYGLAGAVLGLALALLIAVVLDRRAAQRARSQVRPTSGSATTSTASQDTTLDVERAARNDGTRPDAESPAHKP